MKILLNKDDLIEALKSASNLGFVPTMGSLHKGHISLIKHSKKICKQTIVSIFVNPTQFNDKKDYKKYPRNKKKDLSILKKLNINFVFLPNKKDIYNYKRKKKIKILKKDKVLCAKYRKGHFEGVIDVMDRLTKMIKPRKIFLGEKDFQQIFLIRKYIQAKKRNNIVLCKTVRDKQKLALSSRNNLLNNNQLKVARNISQDLINLKKKLNKSKNIQKIFSLKKKKFNDFKDVRIEYLELRNKITLEKSSKIKNSKIFIAYHIKNIRLIDNF